MGKTLLTFPDTVYYNKGMNKNSIKVSDEVLAQLAKLKHPGQSWDGVLRELLERETASNLREEIRKQADSGND